MGFNSGFKGLMFVDTLMPAAVNRSQSVNVEIVSVPSLDGAWVGVVVKALRH